ncbi:uncharacterized protein EI90DRAFT_3092675 [Cantharellus anzutake]|uniref:uncharacterized protein n=1 Tax=Cantharellus anzutake TaxID=1750568 RepID=UPI0019066105|nr:uncharacterized protein EI90DRAFT_3092675 [Cantharellus anzutake]KAF8312889.1 hypothetical protein EI90DRAFT_3092675 [Cantharellus anzutake]
MFLSLVLRSRRAPFLSLFFVIVLFLVSQTPPSSVNSSYFSSLRPQLENSISLFGGTLDEDSQSPAYLLKDALPPLHGDDHSSSSQVLYPHRPKSPSPITMIVMWSPTGGKTPVYMNTYFSSVLANPTIDLLLIKFDREGHGVDCGPMAPQVDNSNIREVCFSLEDYYERHARWLCGLPGWECSQDEFVKLTSDLKKFGVWDRVSSHFRPFRAAIFHDYIHPDTPIWGWVPWDLAPQFDIIVASAQSYLDEILLYLPGHLCFFRHSQSIVDEFLKYPALRSLEAFRAAEKDGRWIGSDAEEQEYSHFAFTNKNLTFLTFYAMNNHDTYLSSPKLGTYSVINAHHLSDGLLIRNSPLASEASGSRTRPPPDKEQPNSEHIVEHTVPSLRTDLRDRLLLHITHHKHLLSSIHRAGSRSWHKFSKGGFEYEVEIRYGSYQLAWFDKKLAVSYAVDNELVKGKGFGRADSVRYVMRRERGGPITERVERLKTIEFADISADSHAVRDADGGLPSLARTKLHRFSYTDHPYLLECLYTHFQHEKYNPWWDVPEKSLTDEILFVNRDRQNGFLEIWDKSGEVVFESDPFKHDYEK